MGREKPFSEYEAVVLLDSFLQFKSGLLNRKDAISRCSKALRKMATNQGMEIDDIYRNENGISFQLISMESAFTDKEGLKPSTRLFRDVVNMYWNDRERYDDILREARQMAEDMPSQANDFITWLSEHVAPSQLSEYYDALNQIEQYVKKHKLGNCSVYSIQEVAEIHRIQECIDKDGIFQLSIWRKRKVYNSAFNYLLSYVQEMARKSQSAITERDETQPVAVGKEHGATEHSADTSNIRNNQNLESDERNDKAAGGIGDEILQEADQEKKSCSVSKQDKSLVVDFSRLLQLQYTKPLSFEYFDEVKKDVNNWSQLYVSVVRCLLDDYPAIFKGFIDKNLLGVGRIDFTDEAGSMGMASPQKVADDFYVETNFSATDIAERIRLILDICNVDYENLVVRYMYKREVQEEEKATDNESPESVNKEPSKVKKNAVDTNTEKNLFSSWLRTHKYAEKTINSYLSAVSECADALRQFGIFDADLFLIDDVDTLRRLKKALFAKSEMAHRNLQQHNMFSAALRKLIEFRSDDGDIIDTDRPSSKEEGKRPEPNSDFPSSEIASNYQYLLTKYFGSDGYQPGRAIFRGRVRRFYMEEYGNEAAESDEQIDLLFRRLGTERDGRIFPKQDNEQVNLVGTIVADIMAAFSSGATAVYVEAVFEKYDKQLADTLMIYRPDALTPLLLENAKGRYRIQRNSFLCMDKAAADPTSDLVRVMKTFHQPQSVEDIHKLVWYIPFDKIKSILSLEKSIVCVDKGTYFYAPNLPVNADELALLSGEIRKELMRQSYLTGAELMELIREKCPSIAINTNGFTTYGLRDCLGYLLRDVFVFNGPIISAQDNELSLNDVYSEFAKKHETLSLDDIKYFSSEMKTPIYWESIFGEMVRVSEREFVRRDFIHFDVDAIDTVLGTMCPGNYVPLKDITLFLHFPNIGFQWNSYILESYLFQGSQMFKLLHISFGQNSVCGAMVRVESPISDYRTMILDALVNSNSLNSVPAALDYIVGNGFQLRRRFDGIEQLVQEARLKKEQREKQEK